MDSEARIETLAFVVDGPKSDFALVPVVFDPIRDDEYLVEMKFSGICHTDILLQQGLFGDACQYPAIFGHEGAGIIRQVGKHVRQPALQVGDPVLLSFFTCNHCPSCLQGQPARCWNFIECNFSATRYSDKSSHARLKDGRPVGAGFFGHSSFAKLSVVKDQCAVKYPYQDVENMGIYAGGGCGFQTGAGAILNLLKPKPEQALVIFGLGGVGLTAVMAAKLRGLQTVIAVDIVDFKLELARELGATHIINSSDTDPLAEIKRITTHGATYAIDCSGVPSVIELLIDCIHPFGVAGSIGDAPAGERISIDALKFMVEGKTFVGLVEGDSVPQKFLPELVDLHRAGKFPLDRLVSIYSSNDFEQALRDMEAGKIVKCVIRWD
ncbi:aryl-alcohol dehydrogenase [Microdochium nivale]|nr:aryl-alcohol dehydrogenase [Microdochium nivale]